MTHVLRVGRANHSYIFLVLQIYQSENLVGKSNVLVPSEVKNVMIHQVVKIVKNVENDIRHSLFLFYPIVPINSGSLICA